MVSQNYESSKLLQLVALVIVCGIANAQVVTLRFDRECYVVYNSLSAYCDSSLAPSWTYVSQFQFEDVNQSRSYKLSRNCTTGVTTVLNNTFTGTVQQLSSQVGVTWASLSQNDGGIAYRCAIATCPSSPLVVSSNTAKFTVIQDPGYSSINIYPPLVSENVNTTILLVCEGFVGNPGGQMKLQLRTENRTVSPGKYTFTDLATFEPDGSGYVRSSYQFSVVWTRDYILSNNVWYLCFSYNKICNISSSYGPTSVYPRLENPPKELKVTASGENIQRQSETQYVIEGAADGSFTVKIQVDTSYSNPSTQVSCKLHSGPAQYVMIYSYLVPVEIYIAYPELNSAVFEINCTGYYFPTISDRNVELYSLIRVFASSGSLIPGSVIIVVALYFVRIFT